MELPASWFLELYHRTGLNFTIAYDSYDRVRFLAGLWLTIELSMVTVSASIIIGLIGAWMQGARSILLRVVISAYVQLFRNTPPLVQLYFFYFGLTALPSLFGAAPSGRAQPIFSGFDWACLSLSLYAGSFNVEIFRSGLEAIPRATEEAAEALGYTRLQSYWYVLLPLAIRICMPGLTNNLVNLIKTTSLAYAIAVPELLYASAQIWSDDSNVPEMMGVLLVVYLVLVGLLAAGLRFLETKLHRPGLGT